MRRKQTSQGMAIGLLIMLMIIFVLSQTSVGTVLLASPWWVYFVLMAIGLCGYMSFKYTMEERRYEQEWIEQEGDVYMERLREEKEKRQDNH